MQSCDWIVRRWWQTLRTTHTTRRRCRVLGFPCASHSPSTSRRCRQAHSRSSHPLTRPTRRQLSPLYRRPRRRPAAPRTNCLSLAIWIVGGPARVRKCPTLSRFRTCPSMCFRPRTPTRPPVPCFCCPVTAVAMPRLWHRRHHCHARYLPLTSICPSPRRCYPIFPAQAVCRPRGPCPRSPPNAPTTQMPRGPRCMAQQLAHMPLAIKERSSMCATCPHTFGGRTSRTCSAEQAPCFELMCTHRRSALSLIHI